jgi:hypothetical protein
MADRAKKVTELTAATSVADGDLLLVVADPAGTPITKKVTKSAFLLSVTSNTLIMSNRSTPANSTITVAQGTIFFDADYIYVAVANNTLKRAPLTGF